MKHFRKVYLEISNICNLHCSFCPGTKREHKRMSIEEFTDLLYKLTPWTDYLYFHLMGEPLCHPNLKQFLEIADIMHFKVILTTNGTLLEKNKRILLNAPALHKINISLHAFEANEPGMPFEEYISDALTFAKKSADSGIITVLRLWNLDGRADGALNTKNDQILALMREHFPSEWVQTRSGYRLASRVFLEWGDKFDWPDLNGNALSDTGFCYGLRDQIGVLADGTVVPCCLDRDGDIVLGNLFDTPLANILATERARAIYDGFTGHECTEALCKRCMRAGYYKNVHSKKLT